MGDLANEWAALGSNAPDTSKNYVQQPSDSAPIDVNTQMGEDGSAAPITIASQKALIAHMNYLDQINDRNAQVGVSLAPLTTFQGQVQSGYRTSDGKITRLGGNFDNLVKVGVIDTNNQLTPKGVAMTMDDDNITKPENFGTYKLKDQLGLNKSKPTSWYDDLSGVSSGINDLIVDAVKFVPAIQAAVLGDNGDPNATDKNLTDGFGISRMSRSEGQTRLSGFAGGVLKFGPWLASGFASLIDKSIAIGSEALGVQTDEDTKNQLLAASQRHDADKLVRDKQQIRDVIRSVSDVTTLLANPDSKQSIAAASVSGVADSMNQAVSDGQNIAKSVLGSNYNPILKSNEALGDFAASSLLLGLGESVAGARALTQASRAADSAYALEGLQRDLSLSQSVLERTQGIQSSYQPRFDQAVAVGDKSLADHFMNRAVGLTDTIEELKSTVGDISGQIEKHQNIVDTFNAPSLMDSAMSDIGGAVNQTKAGLLEAAGSSIKAMGTGLEWTNNFLDKSSLVRASRGVAGEATSAITAAVTGHLPTWMASTAINYGLKSGPLFQAVGDFTKIVGKEAAEQAGSNPLWQRVAARETTGRFGGMFANTMAMLPDISGVVGDSLKLAAKTYPLVVAYNAINEGGVDSSTFSNSIVPSLFFGTGGAILGHVFGGDAKTMSDYRSADTANFRNDLANHPESKTQTANFEALHPQAQQFYSTYAATHPNVNFDFKTTGDSFYDRGSNTVVRNVNDNNTLGGITNHEIARYELRDKVSAIRELYLGSDGEGGLVQTSKGVVDPNFQKWIDAENGKRAANSKPALSLEDAAIEHYTQEASNYILDNYNDGSMQSNARKAPLTRYLSDKISNAGSSLADSIKELNTSSDSPSMMAVKSLLPDNPLRSKLRSAIESTIVSPSDTAKRIHFNGGGAMDSTGKLIKETGVLSWGIADTPGAKSILDRALNKNINERVYGKKSAIPVESKVNINASDAAMLHDLHPILATDQAGTVLVGDRGEFSPKSPVTERQNRSGKDAAIKMQREVLESATALEPHDLQIKPDGSIEGQTIPIGRQDEFYNDLGLNDKQKKANGILNGILHDGVEGSVQQQVLATYYKDSSVIPKKFTIERFKSDPALREALSPEVRHFTMVGQSITSQGHLLYHAFDMPQINANMEFLLKKKEGQQLYSGSKDTLIPDLQKHFEAVAAGKSSEPYFNQTYNFDGTTPSSAKAHYDFANAVTGEMHGRQWANNSVIANYMPKNSGAYRTFRADKILTVKPTEGNLRFRFSNQSYPAIKLHGK